MEIEAISNDTENPFIESAVTSSNGKYRIMGLVPGKTYSIKVKDQGKQIVMPQEHVLDIQKADTFDVRIF